MVLLASLEVQYQRQEHTLGLGIQHLNHGFVTGFTTKSHNGATPHFFLYEPHTAVVIACKAVSEFRRNYTTKHSAGPMLGTWWIKELDEETPKSL